MGLLSSRKTYNTFQTGLGDTQFDTLKSNQTDIAGIADVGFANVGTGITNLGTKIDGVNTNTNSGFVDLTALLKGYNDEANSNRTTAALDRSTNYGNIIQALENNTGGLATQASLDSAQTALDTGFADTDARFDGLDSSIGSVQNTADNIITDVGTVQSAVDTGFSGAGARFDTLDAGQTNAAGQATANADALGALRILEAIRILKLEKHTKVYQASTSELYGKVQAVPQNEDTPFYPRSPYGVAKLYAYWLLVNYREAYGIFGSNGILFNHESPRRGDSFVTKKVAIAATKIANGSKEILFLGNIDAKRDWGFAPDYVESMWMILQQEQPSDYVIATNETHTVRELVEKMFKHVGIDVQWQGTGVDEIGIDSNSGKEVVNIDPYYYRPTEVDLLIGDYSKAKRELGWEPKTTFNELVEIMMNFEVSNYEK